jgi:hypothetical protein
VKVVEAPCYDLFESSITRVAGGSEDCHGQRHWASGVVPVIEVGTFGNLTSIPLFISVLNKTEVKERK